MNYFRFEQLHTRDAKPLGIWQIMRRNKNAFLGSDVTVSFIHNFKILFYSNWWQLFKFTAEGEKISSNRKSERKI